MRPLGKIASVPRYVDIREVISSIPVINNVAVDVGVEIFRKLPLRTTARVARYVDIEGVISSVQEANKIAIDLTEAIFRNLYDDR